MSNDIIQINSNILKGEEYSVEFFDIRDYTDLDKDFTMYSLWLNFLNTTPTFTIPLISVDSMVKGNKLWFRNEAIQDSATITIDNSPEYNLMNFIARGITAKDVDLEDLIYLGAIIKIEYIDLYGNTQIENIMTGRVSLNTFSDTKLSLNITPFNDIMKGSDFEKNVVKNGDGASYNYISLEQAFSNIYNVPHNVIDDISYPCTPFRVEQSTYVPADKSDIVLTDGNLQDNWSVYAEDTVANTTDYVHCQFFYTTEEPNCGVKMTTYNDVGDPISSESTLVSGWNVWGNTQDALNSWTEDNYRRDFIKEYSRYFRPFKVAIASDLETQAFDARNGRVIRNVNLAGDDGDVFGLDETFYNPVVNNGIYTQQTVSGGQYVCQPGDTLIYFEQCGDVRFFNNLTDSPSANILYDQHSNIYVYNFTRDIVYFNHIANQVQSTPLPKQWLDMRSFIGTEKMYFASRLDYRSDNNSIYIFGSQVKPHCHVEDNDAFWDRVATEGSIRINQDQYGRYGTFKGEKQVLMNALGVYDVDNGTDFAYLENALDYIEENIKPKSVKISDDGSKLYFMRNIESGFSAWNDSSFAEIVPPQDYATVNQFTSIQKLCSKDFFILDENGDYSYNKKEYGSLVWCNHESTTPVYNSEVTDFVNSGTIVLQNGVTFTPSGNFASGYSFARTTGSYSAISDKTIIYTNDTKESINSHVNNGDTYWSTDDLVFKGLNIYKDYNNDWKVLNFNKDIERAIIQQLGTLVYYDTLNNVVLESTTLTGFEYILSMVRTRMIFTNPLSGESDELIRIGSVTAEVVRLLSYSGNRYQAGVALANTFFKNMNYDNNGILQIGYTERYNNLIIQDSQSITCSSKSVKYDVIEWSKYVINKNEFTSVDNDEATNQEEDNNSYDEAVSIAMWSNKDIEMNVTVKRVSSTQIEWTASNDFGSETDVYTENDFTLFQFDLTEVFTGITIFCNFYNTELPIGGVFNGRIKKRELKSSNITDKILSTPRDFIFLDDKSMVLKPSFLYKLNSEQYKQTIEDFFLNGSKIKKIVSYNVIVPELLLFDLNQKIVSAGDLLQFRSNIIETNGFAECYIEKMVYDFKHKNTKFNLITFD